MGRWLMGGCPEALDGTVFGSSVGEAAWLAGIELHSSEVTKWNTCCGFSSDFMVFGTPPWPRHPTSCSVELQVYLLSAAQTPWIGFFGSDLHELQLLNRSSKLPEARGTAGGFLIDRTVGGRCGEGSLMLGFGKGKRRKRRRTVGGSWRRWKRRLEARDPIGW